MALLLSNMGLPHPMTQPIFDLQRQTVLISEFPSVHDAVHTSTSTTKSRCCLRWRILQPWNEFENLVADYFTTVFTANDATALIMHSGALWGLFAAVNGAEIYTEDDIRGYSLQFVQEVHNIVARGKNGAPLPSDWHASFVNVSSGSGNYGLIGVPDFAMYHDLQQRVCSVGEAKNPWNVTPEQIDEVLNGIKPPISC
jgi:hypothetical protein